VIIYMPATLASTVDCSLGLKSAENARNHINLCRLHGSQPRSFCILVIAKAGCCQSTMLTRRL